MQCLNKSGVAHSEISLIFSGINDWGTYEWAEKNALEEIRNEYQDFTPCIVSLQKKVGNCLGASGAVSFIAALGALNKQEIYSALYQSSVTRGKICDKPKYIMINAFGCGSFATMLIKGIEE
jgi:3-oxoacyl-(acyl-carrier-protein) synthase